MAQAMVNEEPWLTGVASSKDRWVEASHWKRIISLSSSESLPCERESMRPVIPPGQLASSPRQKGEFLGQTYHRRPF